MTSARSLLVGRRRWIAAGSMSIALSGVITQQLLPTAAEAAPQVSAQAASDPVVVEPGADAVLAAPVSEEPAPVSVEPTPAAVAPAPAAAPARKRRDLWAEVERIKQKKQ